ncbi:MAG: SH3 domain-containing protein, partial [Bacillota bacterium]|nr:SH3 domain-containing protein [Bacillota bacterium]
MLRKLAILSIGATLFFGVFTPQSNILAAKTSITISADDLNVRKGPGLTYPVVQKAKQGQTFPIIKEDSQWYMVDLGNGQTGWVANWFAVKNPPPTDTFSPSANLAIALVNSNGLRVRKGPGTSFQIIASLNKGDKVRVVESNENWYKISASFGVGWVSRQFLEVKDNTYGNGSTKINPANKNEVKKGIVSADFLNVRSAPSRTGTIIGKLLKGATVKIYSSQADWMEISFSNQKAWVMS